MNDAISYLQILREKAESCVKNNERCLEQCLNSLVAGLEDLTVRNFVTYCWIFGSSHYEKLNPIFKDRLQFDSLWAVVPNLANFICA